MERKESKGREMKTNEKIFSTWDGLKFFFGKTKMQISKLEMEQWYLVLVEKIFAHFTRETDWFTDNLSQLRWISN